MNILKLMIDFIFHVDEYLGLLIQYFGIFTYVFLFLIILLETGLVITPFLPGDSLLFVSGVFASKNILNIFVLFLLFFIAAVLGDNLNYSIGNFVGEKFFLRYGLVKKEYLEKTREFYKKHGKKTIVLARFFPIIRTIAPFIAGIGKMNMLQFFVYNVLGAFLWTSIFLFGGYFFGTIPFVEKNLSFFILGIIFVSFIPVLIKSLFKKKNEKEFV